jgi:hypothetical protein
MKNATLVKTLGGTMILAAGLSLTACGTSFKPEGPYASLDQYAYQSLAMEPKTVVLRDVRTEQILYTWDIPVDQTLVLKFRKDQGERNRAMPDKLEWDLWPIDQTTGHRRYYFFVPAADSRRVEMYIRNTPELPYDMQPADSPVVMIPPAAPSAATINQPALALPAATQPATQPAIDLQQQAGAARPGSGPAVVTTTPPAVKPTAKPVPAVRPGMPPMEALPPALPGDTGSTGARN